MVRRMTGPRPLSATEVSRETGIPQPTLSRWLRMAATFEPVSNRDPKPPKSTTTPASSKRAQDWTPHEKVQAVLDAASMSDDELGAYLRRTGLHREQLEQWRRQALDAAANALGENTGRRKRGSGPTPEQKRIRELEKQLRRKDRALAEAAALLVLKKKADAWYGDEEDETDPRSDE